MNSGLFFVVVVVVVLFTIKVYNSSVARENLRLDKTHAPRVLKFFKSGFQYISKSRIF